MAKSKPAKRNAQQIKEFIEHSAGVNVTKKKGRGTHDPNVVRAGHEVIVTGGNMNMDSAAIVQQRAYAPDSVVRELQGKTGKNVYKLWDVFEKSRAAYSAAKHTHRDKLLERHKKEVKKSIVASDVVAYPHISDPKTIEESIRGLMYGHRLVEMNPHAQTIWYKFRDKINDAITSDDALDAIRVSYKIAEFYNWLVEQEKDPPPPPPPPPGEDEDPPPPPVADPPPPPPGKEKAPPPPQDEDKDPPPGPVEPPEGQNENPPPGPEKPPVGPNPDDTDEVDEALEGILDPYSTNRRHGNGPGGESNVDGSASASSGATSGGNHFTTPDTAPLSPSELREKLKEILATKQEEAKAAAASWTNNFGVHDYEIKRPDSTETEVIRDSPIIKMILSETRGRTDSRIGRRGAITGRAWQAPVLGNMNVFRKKPDTQGDIVVLVDMSGSMGCGCNRCNGEELDLRRLQCLRYSEHLNDDPNQGLTPRTKRMRRDAFHSPCTPDPSWTEHHATRQAEYLRNGNRSRAAWLAKQAVSAITERFPQAKVYGFSDGSKTGTVIVPLENRQWLNDKGKTLVGGGTPTCGALQFLQDLLSGAVTDTTAILIMDGSPYYTGSHPNYFKDTSKHTYCNTDHYAQQAAEFHKRGMNFGIVEVGRMSGAIAVNLDVPVGSSVVIKSEAELPNIASLFQYLDKRNG